MQALTLSPQRAPSSRRNSSSVPGRHSTSAVQAHNLRCRAPPRPHKEYHAPLAMVQRLATQVRFALGKRCASPSPIVSRVAPRPRIPNASVPTCRQSRGCIHASHQRLINISVHPRDLAEKPHPESVQPSAQRAPLATTLHLHFHRIHGRHRARSPGTCPRFTASKGSS